MTQNSNQTSSIEPQSAAYVWRPVGILALVIVGLALLLESNILQSAIREISGAVVR